MPEEYLKSKGASSPFAGAFRAKRSATEAAHMGPLHHTGVKAHPHLDPEGKTHSQEYKEKSVESTPSGGGGQTDNPRWQGYEGQAPGTISHNLKQQAIDKAKAEAEAKEKAAKLETRKTSSIQALADRMNISIEEATKKYNLAKDPSLRNPKKKKRG